MYVCIKICFKGFDYVYFVFSQVSGLNYTCQVAICHHNLERRY